MRIKTVFAIGISVLACGNALAAAPRLTTSKSVDIDASASKVWRMTKDFNALNTWHPALASDEIVEGTNNVVGAVRLLTLKGGGTIKEKLLVFNPAARTYKYSIVEGVVPVSDYKATFVVKSAGKGKSTATWSAHFKRKDLGDSPADNANDKAALDAINGVFQSGLDNLKKLAEAQ